MGFPTKNDHFGVCFWGTTILGNPVKGTNKAARPPGCLAYGQVYLEDLEAFFFGANCGHKETKNIFKKNMWEIYTQSIHVWCISLHLPLMKFYKDQANVYRYSKYTSAMDGTVV